MTDYKQAGDLVPDDVYIRRRGTRAQIFRVITTRPGSAATIVEVITESMKTGKRSTDNFFRNNRVEIVPREPQKGEELRPCNYGEAVLRRDAGMARAREMGPRAGMTRRTIPTRHWRTYGNDPLPTGAEALVEPFAAFPSWFLRIECDRCGKVQMVNQEHYARPNMPIRAILAKMRHERCGGRAGKAELLTGIEGVSSRPVRRIKLRGG